MNTSDLQQLATRTRWMREAGIALLLCSLVLVLFLFVPLSPGKQATAAVALATTTPDAFANIPLQAKAAIVYDLTTGQVLFAKNDDAQLPLASLTKLLTVYTALSVLGPDAVITIPQDATGLGAPSSFSAGEQFTLSNLARITLTGSLNDGATAMADAAAAQEGTTDSAALGATATKLGLSQTYALNGSGLDESATVSGGYGSAYDIAILAGDLVKLAPDVTSATTGSSASATSLAGVVHTANNTDIAVTHFPRLLLSKTGYTDLAGGNLALVFDAGIGHPIAIVVLGSTEDARFTDGNTLVAATLAHFAGTGPL
jgi:D-alanyl-D-alanine carboxypeptidase (penicillin-binding protein 5/6)